MKSAGNRTVRLLWFRVVSSTYGTYTLSSIGHFNSVTGLVFILSPHFAFPMCVPIILKIEVLYNTRKQYIFKVEVIDLFL